MSATQQISIFKIESNKDYKRFVDFPHSLYEADANYVPELHIAVREILNPKKNPFFKHSKASFFLAEIEGKIVGRIAAIRNNNYNDFHNCNIGFFGFFDVIDNFEVAKTLLDQAVDWCKAEGLDAVLGPTNLTTNDTSGILVEGFDRPPIVQMTYNKPYYDRLVKQYGFVKDMDLFAYWLPTDKVNDKSLRLSERIQERLAKRGISFRNIDVKNFKKEVATIKGVYSRAWENNWGFVPPTPEEFDHIAEGLKMVVDPKFGYVAEQNGEMIGFALGLPDINEILIDNKRGRLFPTGIFKLLMGKSKVKKVRIILLGVVEEHRKAGIEAVFFGNFIKAAKENGLLGGEASWVLDSNEMMKAAAEKMNGEKYKTYRIYRYDIN